MITPEEIEELRALEIKFEARVEEISQAYMQVRGWDSSVDTREIWLDDDKFVHQYEDKWAEQYSIVLDLKYLYMPNVKEIFRMEYEQYLARKQEQSQRRELKDKENFEKGERRILKELATKYPDVVRNANK